MKRLFFYLSVFLILATIASCKKDNGSSNGAGLTGNWKFVSMQGTTTTTEQYSDGFDSYKTISAIEYTTTDNVGTATFDATTVVGNGIGYKVATTMHSELYIDNALEDTFAIPISVQLGPVNSTTKYTVVGADSLYFEGQSVFNVDPTGGVSNKSGAKYSISGKTLTMTMNVAHDSVVYNSGYPTSQHVVASLVSTMERQ
jgi:hypothetical protein